MSKNLDEIKANTENSVIRESKDKNEEKDLPPIKKAEPVTEDPGDPPEGLVKVKNLLMVNIFASNGKIGPKGIGFVSKEDAESMKKKEMVIEV